MDSSRSPNAERVVVEERSHKVVRCRSGATGGALAGKKQTVPGRQAGRLACQTTLRQPAKDNEDQKDQTETEKDACNLPRPATV